MMGKEVGVKYWRKEKNQNQILIVSNMKILRLLNDLIKVAE